jgi:heme-degrading monooxygenase HmoA
MFVVIFEVQPKKERWDEYLSLAKHLKPKLEATDGFIEIDRLADRQVEGRVLSLSTFRDEKSVVRWRSHGEHHGVQARGRAEIFADYHLRVGEVVSDTHPPEGLPRGATPMRRGGGSPRHPPARRCGTVASASCATTACSTDARRRSSIGP